MDTSLLMASLKRHKLIVGLLILQIVLSVSVATNAFVVVVEKASQVLRPSGAEEQELLALQLIGATPSTNSAAQTTSDLEALRQLAGARDVGIVNQVPYGRASQTSDLRLASERNAPSMGIPTYFVSSGAVKLLGIKLVEGKDFEPADIRKRDEFFKNPDAPLPGVLVSRSLATRLWPGESALGKKVWGIGEGSQVIGVFEQLTVPHPSPTAAADYTVIAPVQEAFDRGSYIVRASPGDIASVRRAALKALAESGAKRIVRESRSIDELRSAYYAKDRFLVILLIAVSLAVTLVTALGTGGLLAYWVDQRAKSIGISRALGATPTRIWLYLQVESGVITAIGVALGLLCTTLMAYQGEGAIDRKGTVSILQCFAAATLLVGLSCQISAFLPARQAGRIEPSMALK